MFYKSLGFQGLIVNFVLVLRFFARFFFFFFGQRWGQFDEDILTVKIFYFNDFSSFLWGPDRNWNQEKETFRTFFWWVSLQTELLFLFFCLFTKYFTNHCTDFNETLRKLSKVHLKNSYYLESNWFEMATKTSWRKTQEIN